MNELKPTKTGIGRQCVLIDVGVLQLVKNTLQRSFERGNKNHGEILDELTKATFNLPEKIRSSLCSLDEVNPVTTLKGNTPVLTLDVDFSGYAVEYRISSLHPGIEELTHGKYQLFIKV